jgi:PhnO protein
MDTKATVFLLEHLHEYEDGGESVKTIGIYSARDAAQQAAERLRSQPGFRDAPDGFSIDPYTVDMDHWEEGYLSTGRTGQSPGPNGKVSACSVRPIEVADAAAAAALCAELGYPVSTTVLEQRIRALSALPDHAVLVACVEDGRVAGWIDVSITYHLPAEPYGEIGGLVVSEDVRGQGIGRELLAAAERWISERGIGQALVRSRVVRERAHRFYLREGYSHTKTSAVFVKPLPARRD